MEKGLGHLLIASSSSHFFNKADFEKYLLTKQNFKNLEVIWKN